MPPAAEVKGRRLFLAVLTRPQGGLGPRGGSLNAPCLEEEYQE